MAGDRKIGVALDFSKSSKRALQWAIDNLLIRGESLYVLHVVRPKSSPLPSHDCLDDTSLIPPTEFRELEVTKSYDMEVDTEVHSMLDTASRQKKAKIVMKLYLGDAREKLCEAAKELKLDSLNFFGRCIKVCGDKCIVHCHCYQRHELQALINPPIRQIHTRDKKLQERTYSP